MRLLRRLLIFLFLCSCSYAQFATVSGTVVDSSGQAWAGGTFTLVFTPSPYNPATPVFQGSIYFTKSFSGSLSSTGTYSVTNVPRSDYITPVGTYWSLTVCPAATASCYTVAPTTVNSASYTLNATPPPISINPNPNSFSSAYSNSEISGGAPGTLYFNLTDSNYHVCQSGNPCTLWMALATYNGNPVFTTVTAQAVNGVLNATQFTGSDIGAKINAAVAYLNAANQCGTIIVPPGNYDYTITIVKPACDIIEGQTAGQQDVPGYPGTALVYTGTGVGLVIADNSNTDRDNGGLRHIGIFGPAASGSTIGVYVGGDPAGVISPSTDTAPQQTIYDAYISGFGIGLKVGNNASFLTIDGNTSFDDDGIGYEFPSGISGSSEQQRLINLQFTNNLNGSVVSDAAANSGDIRFIGDSFDYSNGATSTQTTPVTTPEVSGGGIFVGCHFEHWNGPFIDNTTYGGNIDVVDSKFLEQSTAAVTDPEMIKDGNANAGVTLKNNGYISAHTTTYVLDYTYPGTPGTNYAVPAITISNALGGIYSTNIGLLSNLAANGSGQAIANATYNSGFSVSNGFYVPNTLATSSVSQNSPNLNFIDNVWNSTNSASEPEGWYINAQQYGGGSALFLNHTNLYTTADNQYVVQNCNEQTGSVVALCEYAFNNGAQSWLIGPDASSYFRIYDNTTGTLPIQIAPTTDYVNFHTQDFFYAGATLESGQTFNLSSGIVPGFSVGNNLANYLTLAGAASGSAPTITCGGSDTNVSCNLVPKGTGTVQANGLTVATQGSNGLSAGTITISSSTSGTHTFTTAYTSAPVCVASENSSSPTALTFGVTSSTTTVTVTLSASGSGTFTWQCFPAEN